MSPTSYQTAPPRNPNRSPGDSRGVPRPSQDRLPAGRETALFRVFKQGFDTGGGGGIRTHGPLARTTVFETAPFDLSGTPPGRIYSRFPRPAQRLRVVPWTRRALTQIASRASPGAW